jgi:hypothetical protein
LWDGHAAERIVDVLLDEGTAVSRLRPTGIAAPRQRTQPDLVMMT